jgi:hypothetical protein
MSRKRVLLLAAALVLAAGGFVAWQLWPKSLVPPAWANDYDVNARPPELMAPGTVVGSGPPEGWSHLVIKSLPRVRPGEEAKIPGAMAAQTIRMTRWLFTAFVADVRPETQGGETRHHLRAVALGLGTAVNGRDTIVTLETAKQYGLKLDWITETILKNGYETQKLAMTVAHGPTFAVVDTPVWFRCGQKNRLVRFRYGLLVDAATGRLDVLVWMLDPQGGCGDTGVAVLLNPSQINEAELIPDPKEFNLIGVANDATFGVDQLPPHRAQLVLPAGVRGLAARTKFSADEARDLEAALRKLVAP